MNTKTTEENLGTEEAERTQQVETSSARDSDRDDGVSPDFEFDSRKATWGWASQD